MQMPFGSLAGVLLLTLLAGCASVHPSSDLSAVPFPEAPTRAPYAQRFVWNATIEVEVEDVALGVEGIVGVISSREGRVEERRLRGDKHAVLVARVPVADLDASLDEIAAFGREKSRTVSARDVREQMIDAGATLQNARALRDRLRELLAKATQVQDVLAIETELARVQGEVDAISGRLSWIRSQVDDATLRVVVQRAVVLGPLGHVAKGLGWFVEKLFIWN